MNLPRWLCCAACVVVFPQALPATEVNILDEGGFETAAQGMPAGFVWAGFAGDPSITPNRFSMVTEDSQFVRIMVPSATEKEVANIKLKDPIPAPREWTALAISVALRVRDYLQGMEPWHGVKVFVQFSDAEGNIIGSEVPAITVKENVDSWTNFQKEITIPPGTASFTLTAGFFGSSGEVDIDDLAVVPVK
jgi:hypothetical protein